MKIEDVFALSNAGFSQEQILALSKFMGSPDISNKENVVVESQKPSIPAEPVPTEPPTVMPEPVAEPVVEQPKQNVNLDPVLDEIKKLVSTVQQSNINTSQNTVPKAETTDDILASIIRPPKSI